MKSYINFTEMLLTTNTFLLSLVLQTSSLKKVVEKLGLSK